MLEQRRIVRIIGHSLALSDVIRASLCILFESTTQQIGHEAYESVRNSRGKRKRVSDIYRVILFVCNRV